jgi:hypothetical protein
MSNHPVGTWPECEHCFGAGAAMNYHRGRKCMESDPYRTPCKPSKVNPNKCDWLIHHESIILCPLCRRWANKVLTADWGQCNRCLGRLKCDIVTEENRAYRKSRGEWDGW